MNQVSRLGKFLSMEFLCGIACHKSDSPKWNLHDWQACAFWDAFQPSPAYPRVGGPARPSGPGDLLISLRIPPQPAPVQPAGTTLHCTRGVGESKLVTPWIITFKLPKFVPKLQSHHLYKALLGAFPAVASRLPGREVSPLGSTESPGEGTRIKGPGGLHYTRIIPAFLAKMYPHRTRIFGKTDPHREITTLKYDLWTE